MFKTNKNLREAHFIKCALWFLEYILQHILT